MADFVFEDPFDDSIEDIRASLFDQVDTLWPDPDNRPDTREGSLLWTLLSPIAFEIQRFQGDLNLALQIGFLQFTFGEFLDLKGIEVGLERKQGSKAEGILRFLGDIGTTVPTGTTVSNTVVTDEDPVYLFDTTESGVIEGIANPVNVNEVQKINVSGADRFTLTMDGETTTPLSANATGATIAAALEALYPTTNYATAYNISGDSGIANSGGATVTFDGGSVAGKDIPALVFTPYQVNEQQRLVISGTGNYKITFDGEENLVFLNENSTGTDVVNALNSIVPTTNNTYGTWTVSTTTPLTQVDAPGGVIIVFDGGGVQYKNVPAIQITSADPGITASVTTLVTGEDSASTAVIEELVKGRAAAPIASTADKNEIQRLTYVQPEITVTNDGPDGEPGAKNQIHRLSIPGTPTSGSFDLTFNDGNNSYTTVPIMWNDGAIDIEVALAALPNIGSMADVNVSLVSGGPLISDGSAIFHIELVGNLRNQNFAAITIGSNTLSPAIVLPSACTIVQTATVGLNEKQVIQFVDNIDGVLSGPAADGGVFDITIEDEGGTGPETLYDIPYNVTAGELEVRLEDSSLYGRGTSNIFTVDANAPAADTASAIQAKLEALPGINVGDVAVSLLSGTATLAGWANPVFEVEFQNGLGNTSLPLMKVRSSTNTFSFSVPQPTRTQVGGPLNNEKQILSFPGTVTSGSVDIQFFEASNLGDNFIVTGGPLHQAPITIEYAGKNRFKDFKLAELTTSFTGAPSSGTYKLNFNGNVVPTAAIAADADTQTVETDLNALATVTSAGGVTVRVANGMQTLEYAGGIPTSGVFQLTVDDGVNPSQNTAALNYNCTTADVKTALEALSIVGAGNVEVATSGGLMDSGATYTVYFLNANTVSYRHMVETGSTLNNAATVYVGPRLSDLGAAYEIEFGNMADVPLMTYEDDDTLLLSPEPNEPVISLITDGDIGTKEKQLLTLSHPAGMFRLVWGSGMPNYSALISPLMDTAQSIEYKLNAITDFNTDVAVTGGPLYSAPVFVEFSGLTLSGTDWPLFIVDDNTITGGYLEPVVQMQPGFNGAGGTVTGTVQYVYTVVTNLGVQDGPDDIDYEENYGETAQSVASTPLVVSNNKVNVEIAPLLISEGLTAPRKVKVFRKLTTGFTSTPYRLIDTINEGDLQLVSLGDDTLPPNMYIVDNVPLSMFNAIEETVRATNTTGVVDLQAEAQEIGEGQNVAERTLEVLEDGVSGVAKVTNPEPFGGGSDVESDDDYRARLIEFIQKDPGAGNIDDYVSWAKEVPGISGASCIPEWQEIYGPLEGPGTVKVIVAGEGSTVIPDSKVEEVRQFIAGTIAIEDPDQDNAPAALAVGGGDIENGLYEYCYTFINVGKGETKPSAPATVVVGNGNNTVELHIAQGPGGLGVQNTIGRRIYRRKIDGAVTNEYDSERFCLVAEVLNNVDTTYIDSAAFSDLPTWLGYPAGPYQRRKAPIVNSTSLFDGEAPIGAHVTVQSITEETVWVSATIYPASGYSIDGSGGTNNLTTQLDIALNEYFTSLEPGTDIKYINIGNVLHDHPGVKDFKDLTLYSPVFPLGTEENIPVGPGVSALYSSAGTFTTWSSYPYDKT